MRLNPDGMATAAGVLTDPNYSFEPAYTLQECLEALTRKSVFTVSETNFINDI